jgi:hypothetical protein
MQHSRHPMAAIVRPEAGIDAGVVIVTVVIAALTASGR